MPRPVFQRAAPANTLPYRSAALAVALLVAPAAFAQDPFESVPGPAPPPVQHRPKPPPHPAKPRPPPREPEQIYEPAVARPVAPQPPPPPARPAFSDGNWEVHGSATSHQCGSWSVRIAAAQGRLSGSFFVGDTGENVGLLPIRDLALRPDGTFSGTGVTASQGVYQFSGRLSGDLMSLTMTSVSARCPDTRTGQGRRSG